MFEKLKGLAGEAKDAITKTTVVIADLNGDGKVDEKDARIAADWAKKTAGSIGDEAARLGRVAARSDMGKDAATGAAIGAVVAIPLPIVGPMAGAAIGAGLGVFKNLSMKEHSSSGSPMIEDQPKPVADLHAELIQLEDLRQKGILTEEEFTNEKQKLLGERA